MIEEQLAQKVESILNARVGPGNARVRVSVDLTTEREVRVSRTFDPAQQVARSIETRVRNSNETDPAAATVGRRPPPCSARSLVAARATSVHHTRTARIRAADR